MCIYDVFENYLQILNCQNFAYKFIFFFFFLLTVYSGLNVWVEGKGEEREERKKNYFLFLKLSFEKKKGEIICLKSFITLSPPCPLVLAKGLSQAKNFSIFIWGDINLSKGISDKLNTLKLL